MNENSLEIEQKAEAVFDRRTSAHNRRVADKWWGIFQVVVSFALPALFVLIATMWLQQNRQQDKIDNILNIIGDIKTDTKSATKDILEITRNLDITKLRLDKQDERMQIQAQGLIEGNKSIHEALQQMLILTSSTSGLERKISELERRK